MRRRGAEDHGNRCADQPATIAPVQRPAILVLAALTLVGALFAWLAFGRGDPLHEPGRAPQNHAASGPAAGELTPATGSAERAEGPARDLVAERPSPRQFVVRGTVLAERQGLSPVGARVLAYRGRPGDDRSFWPGAGSGGMNSGGEPSFLLVGEPIATAEVTSDGSFELVAHEADLRLTLEHDYYVLPMPEMVHVPTSGHVDSVVLTPLLGGLLQGQVLGKGAEDVTEVALRSEADPMSVMRDPQLFLGAMASMTGRNATVHDGVFRFRGVLPRTNLTLRATEGSLLGQVRVPQLAAGETREIVLPVRRGAALQVSVVDDAGAPIEGAQVMVTSAADGSSMVPQLHARRGATANDGAVRFDGLEGGNATVEASAKARTTARAEVTLDVTGEPGVVQLRLSEGGVVTGRVLAPDGSPLADAFVAHHPGGSLPIVGNLADQLGPQTLALAARGGVKSAADGTFRLTGLDDDGEFLVVAAHPSYSASYRDGVRMGDVDVQVQVDPQAEVHGRVVRDDSGAPVPEFTVGLLRTAFMVMRMPVCTLSVADATDGAFALGGVASGDYTLRVEVAGLGSVEKNVKIGRGQTDVGELRVEAAAWVRGTVLDATGVPVPRAQIRKRQGGMADNPMLSMFLGAGTFAYSDQNGHFRLGPLNPGRMQLVASVSGHASGRSERLAVGAGEELQDVVITLTEGGSIHGRLQTGPGQFADDFLLMAQEQATQASYGADLAPDGTFRFEHLDPGQYVVQAMPQGLMRGFGAGNWRPGQGMKLGEMMRKITDSVVSQRCTVRDGESSEVLLDARELDDGSVWTVHVEVGGKPLQDGVLEAQSPGTGRVRVAMLENGVGTFGGLPAGDYRLQVRSGMTMAPVGSAQTATLPEGIGTHRTTLALPGGELRGRIVSANDGEPLRAALVRLYHDEHAERDDAVGMALSDGDGSFRFAGLLPGRYTLVAADGPLGDTGTASRREGIEVIADVAGEAIELRAQPAASASVIVTADGGAPLAGVTVLCVDVDGRPIGSLGLAVSGADGKAWFGGLARGAARVVGRAPGFAPGVSEVLEVDPSSLTEFRLDLPRGTRTTVQVFDRDGKMLHGATLTARWGSGPWLPTLLLEEGRGADGSIDLGRLGRGEWQFRVTHPAIGTQETTRTIGDEPSVTLVITPR